MDMGQEKSVYNRCGNKRVMKSRIFTWLKHLSVFSFEGTLLESWAVYSNGRVADIVLVTGLDYLE
jgi:hypothetical protein